ncbi:DUF3147 family protein [Paenibacillus thermotolerans]|uniref:DUF3147 family protein n=1 Tax=Paenibacillus thermotolerans TaxID=3027807 RepID=UPI0023682B97|nr:MULTISPECIES: DUF3147 family protein [unclassified Paenibacillus]
MFFFIKIASSALVIGLITELARKLRKVGGIVAAMPLITIISLFWLWKQGQGPEELGRFAGGVLYGMPATLAFLGAAAFALHRSLPLYVALIAGAAAWGLWLLVQSFLVKW